MTFERFIWLIEKLPPPGRHHLGIGDVVSVNSPGVFWVKRTVCGMPAFCSLGNNAWGWDEPFNTRFRGSLCSVCVELAFRP